MSPGTQTALGPSEWWEATAEGRLMLLRCPACGTAWLPWMPHCPECGPGTGPEPIESSGRGTVYSWVVVANSVSSPDEVPFVVASVMLEEGAMIYGRLTGEAADPIEPDGPVRAVFVGRHGRTVVDFERALGARS